LDESVGSNLPRAKKALPETAGVQACAAFMVLELKSHRPAFRLTEVLELVAMGFAQ
jgi:hypothetical protein